MKMGRLRFPPHNGRCHWASSPASLDRVIRDHSTRHCTPWMRDFFSGSESLVISTPLPDARWKAMVPANPSRNRSPAEKSSPPRGAFNPTGFGVPRRGSSRILYRYYPPGEACLDSSWKHELSSAPASGLRIAERSTIQKDNVSIELLPLDSCPIDNYQMLPFWVTSVGLPRLDHRIKATTYRIPSRAGFFRNCSHSKELEHFLTGTCARLRLKSLEPGNLAVASPASGFKTQGHPPFPFPAFVLRASIVPLYRFGSGHLAFHALVIPI